jgi:hypothetical protein
MQNKFLRTLLISSCLLQGLSSGASAIELSSECDEPVYGVNLTVRVMEENETVRLVPGKNGFPWDKKEYSVPDTSGNESERTYTAFACVPSPLTKGTYAHPTIKSCDKLDLTAWKGKQIRLTVSATDDDSGRSERSVQRTFENTGQSLAELLAQDFDKPLVVRNLPLNQN